MAIKSSLQTQETNTDPASSRRYACDRCRSHKLRCTRDSITTPCHRCARSKSECLISSSFRPRKPVPNRNAQNPVEPGAQATEALSQSSNIHKGEQPNLTELSTDFDGLDHSVIQHPSDLFNHHHNPNRGLEFEPVPWVDEMDLSMEGILERQSTTEDWEPEPASNSTTQIPKLSDFNFDKLQTSYQGLDGLNWATGDQYHNDWDLTKSLNLTVPGQTADGNILQDGTLMAHASNAEVIILEGHTSANGQGYDLTVQKPNSIASEPLDSCIKELAELSANLMQILQKLVTCKVVTSYLFTKSDETIAEYLLKTMDESAHEDSKVIGSMLSNADKFLDILKKIQLALINQSLQCIEKLPESNNSQTLDFQALPKLPQAENLEDRMEARLEILQSYLRRKKAPLHTLSPSTEFSQSDNLSSAESLKSISLPANVTILNCYVCLLKTFHTVFAVIKHSLEGGPNAKIFEKLPPTVPGLQIDGFMLNDRTLQVKILIQYLVSSIVHLDIHHPWQKALYFFFGIMVHGDLNHATDLYLEGSYHFMESTCECVREGLEECGWKLLEQLISSSQLRVNERIRLTYCTAAYSRVDITPKKNCQGDCYDVFLRLGCAVFFSTLVSVLYLRLFIIK
ncbi:hypothetical protein B0O99DRAFT_614784 [Bisporella sp. PMI_857]|nr:hypothetical protein B0O99DRAFT_614784 [Bisporella sp. PMI_857]